jgi:MYXO-CTERM domain-containing protein
MTHLLRTAITLALLCLACRPPSDTEPQQHTPTLSTPATLDVTEPETTLTSAPASSTPDVNATFTFTSDTGTLFECSLDGAAFSSCTSPASFSQLTEGTHTFQVRARDEAGNVDATPASHMWTIDRTAPDTTLTQTPTHPSNETSATFGFSSEAGTTFECSLDGAAFSPCTSPVTYSSLAEGSHTFQVRARDAAGNVDASPAEFSWTLDLGGVDTTLVTTPANPSNDAAATFTFSSEAGATFECSLDGAAFSACTSPLTYSSLAEGMHSFQVRARDAVGNLDDSPASFSWSIDLTAPDTALTATPADPSNETDALFTFSSDDAGATFECSLDGAAFSACSLPAFFDNLAAGAHTFHVRARDAAGNVDASPSGFSWTIDVAELETTLTSAPSSPSNQSSATFSFTANKEGASFECALDGSDFDPCTSPVTYEGLAAGSHTFRVRALDAAGNVDDAPASHSWEVVLPVLDTTLTATPPARSSSTDASFSFTGTEGATFECSLDEVDFSDCTSPVSHTGLAEGQHTFQVRARDAANVDPTPATHAWTIDTTPDTPEQPDAPTGGCGCAAGPGDASWLLGTLSVLAGVASRRRRPWYRHRAHRRVLPSGKGWAIMPPRLLPRMCMPSVSPSLLRPLLAALALILAACDPSATDSSASTDEARPREDAPSARQPASRASLLASSSWSPTGAMMQIRYFHTATLLPNGKVLVVGGSSGSGVLASTELYDPATGTWSATGSLGTARYYHTATLLPTGKVLVAGGSSSSGVALATTELYDPATGTWSTARPLPASRGRNRHTATLLPNGKVLVAGGSGSTGPLGNAELYDPATNTWTSTASLAQARNFHTATLLPNGKVLVAGGYGSGPLTSAELYDPATGTWSATGSLARDRNRHTATLLPNGKVLVAAGSSLQGALALCELYDPATGTWSATGSVSQARDSHTATLLPSGKVLMVGGVATATYYDITELYDPATGTWSQTSPLTQGRSVHVGVLLPSGKVLVAGGESTQYLASAELYEAEAGAWSSTGALNQTRERHSATLLTDGQVLLAGGWSPSGSANTAELYNPATGTASTTGALSQRRSSHTATLLLSGKVLATGGEHSGTSLSSVELYDPATSTWSATASLTQARTGHTATLLRSGKVLAAGGSGATAVTQAELYDPAKGTWSPAGEPTLARTGHTATLLPNGKVLVTGGSNGGTSLATAELYDPATNTWSATGATAQARTGHTATLLPNGKVLVTGGSNGSTPLATTELYDPATGTWSATASLAQARSGHTATLLLSGKVAVTGGSGLASTEVYDPATSTWSTTGALSQARSGHTATLLTSGKVLAAGGALNTTALTSAELYEDTTTQPAWRPELASLSPSSALTSGTVFTVNGTRLRGLSEASNGTTNGSATDFPLLTLTDIPRGQRFTVPLQGFSSTHATGLVPAVPAGRYLLSVTVNALTSSLPLQVTDPAAPDTSITSGPPALTSQTSAAFTFSATLEATFECSLDGAAFTACPSPPTFSNLTEGQHTLRVRARDLDGDVDPTPASHTWTIDLTGPDTSISFKPANPSNQARAVFSFASPEQGTTFECSLDGAAFSACTAPVTYPSLSEGQHTFQVRARDAQGNTDTTPASYTWTLDLTTPETSITSAPDAFSSQTSATFAFSTNEAGATLECALDSTTFSPCTSPATYSNLGEGEHTFQVRSRDVASNMDPTPASHTWNIGLANVNTTLTQAPPTLTKVRTAYFTFSSAENSTFECSLDGAALSVCISPTTYYDLLEGQHTFLVRARDADGNVDPTPASHTWTIDTTPPETTITSAPATITPETSATFAFTSNDAGATFECTLDGTASACTSPVTYANLPEGAHTFVVRASDAAGNSDYTPATHTWSIDLKAPETTITSAPPDPTPQTSATFTFTSNDAGATFECNLDGTPYAACTSPITYSDLAEGPHTFWVRSRDALNNLETSPASHTWTVDALAPAAPVITSPANGALVTDTTPTISGTAQPGSTVTVLLDGSAVGTVTAEATGAWSFTPDSALPEGEHTVSATAMDLGGTSPASTPVRFTIDTGLDPIIPGGGCACAAGPGDASWLLAGLALLAGVASRRRRLLA